MNTVYALIWTHVVADFFAQTDKMAKNKSSSDFWLGFHVLAYSLIFFASFNLYYKVNAVIVYCAVNGSAHMLTDWITSRITKRLWAAGRTHDFFCVIGVDQAIHLTTLVATIPLFTDVPKWR